MSLTVPTIMDMQIQVLEMRRQERVVLEGLLSIQDMVGADRAKKEVVEAIDVLLDEMASDDLSDETPDIALASGVECPNADIKLEVAWLLNHKTQNWWELPADVLEAQMLAAAKRIHSNRLALATAKDEREKQETILGTVIVDDSINVSELLSNRKAHLLALDLRDAAQNQIVSLKSEIAHDEEFLVNIIPEVTTVRLLDTQESQWWTVSWVWDEGFSDDYTMYISAKAVNS